MLFNALPGAQDATYERTITHKLNYKGIASKHCFKLEHCNMAESSFMSMHMNIIGPRHNLLGHHLCLL